MWSHFEGDRNEGSITGSKGARSFSVPSPGPTSASSQDSQRNVFDTEPCRHNFKEQLVLLEGLASWVGWELTCLSDSVEGLQELSVGRADSEATQLHAPPPQAGGQTEHGRLAELLWPG